MRRALRNLLQPLPWAKATAAEIPAPSGAAGMQRSAAVSSVGWPTVVAVPYISVAIQIFISPSLLASKKYDVKHSFKKKLFQDDSCPCSFPKTLKSDMTEPTNPPHLALAILLALISLSPQIEFSRPSQAKEYLLAAKPLCDQWKHQILFIVVYLGEQRFTRQSRHLFAFGRVIVYHGHAEGEKKQPTVLVEEILERNNR